MPRNCRDCAACTRSAIIRVPYTLLVAWWAWILTMFAKPFMKTCPECHHVLGKHKRRADGSYID